MIPSVIIIKKLATEGIIGIHPSERKVPQRLFISTKLYIRDISPAAQTDDIQDTVNYQTIRDDILTVVRATEYGLLESLSCHIAKHLFEHHPIDQIELKIIKPNILTDVEGVGLFTIFTPEDFGFEELSDESLEEFFMDAFPHEDDDDEEEDDDEGFEKINFSIN